MQESKIEDFTDDIFKEINDSIINQEKALVEIIETEADNAVRILKDKSPKRTGDYAKSWTLTKFGNAKGEKFKLNDGTVIVIYNKKHYRLTHLLEKGAIRALTGIMKAEPHITPAYEEIKRNIETKIGG